MKGTPESAATGRGKSRRAKKQERQERRRSGFAPQVGVIGPDGRGFEINDGFNDLRKSQREVIPQKSLAATEGEIIAALEQRQGVEIRCRTDQKGAFTLQCGDYYFWSADNPLPNLRKLKAFLESRDVVYTGIDAPPSEAAVTPQLRMGDDLNIAAKEARAKLRNGLLAAQRLATYEVLVRESDLTNPQLADAVKQRRAGNLLLTYARLRDVRPEFEDANEQLTAARRIQKAGYRERQRAKRGLGPAVRGRPRKRDI
jgi:hypothetical protein